MTHEVYAVVDAGIVTNTIKADEAFVSLITPEHDAVVNVTRLVPMPSIGWDIHGETFRPPTPTPGVWEWDDTAHAWVEVTA